MKILIKRVRVASRKLENARNFADKMARQYDIPIEAVKSVKAAVKNADLIKPSLENC